jgi:hypothetical protein
MTARTRRKTMKKVAKSIRTATAGGRKQLSVASKALERAASRYAQMAGKAGVAAKKKAKKMNKTKTAKILGAAALAAAGYAAVKAARKR